jgi:predicted component of viral defense system (DUF524 family)
MMTIEDTNDWRHLLTDRERAQMLGDIARVSLAVGRLLFPCQIHDDLDITASSMVERKSPVERLGFLERLLPGLTRSVHQIQEAPLTQAAREARMVAPPMRARHVEASAILAAVRRGHADRRWEERVTAWTPETPENRAVKSFLMVLRRDATTIRAMAEASEELEIAQVARNATERLRSLEALPMWAGVSKDTQAWRISPTHRMLTNARYAQLAKAMRHYRDSFQFDWTHPLFRLPARESWRLYEAWGLFQTLEALLALGYVPSPTALFSVRQDRLRFALVQGEASRIGLTAPDGHRVTLFYNRSYPQTARSLSRTMQPDIVLEQAAGLTWVLDTKFKSYTDTGSEGDDIDQMHAYRDAIIDADGKRIVARAWCLFCGTQEDNSRPVIAYGPPSTSIVGALRLHPGEGRDRFCQLLRDWGL